jgi:hypothetical protein
MRKSSKKKKKKIEAPTLFLWSLSQERQNECNDGVNDRRQHSLIEHRIRPFALNEKQSIDERKSGHGRRQNVEQKSFACFT